MEEQTPYQSGLKTFSHKDLAAVHHARRVGAREAHAGAAEALVTRRAAPGPCMETPEKPAQNWDALV